MFGIIGISETRRKHETHQQPTGRLHTAAACALRTSQPVDFNQAAGLRSITLHAGSKGCSNAQLKTPDNHAPRAECSCNYSVSFAVCVANSFLPASLPRKGAARLQRL